MSSDDTRGKKPLGQQVRGKRVPQKQRICEDCEENAATQYCADCQPPLVLCDDCAVLLHRGATRRNHQLKDVSEAPSTARSKSYTPKAYRAPFAMLVAFHRAANEVPNKMSLTADELKPRAQPLTNTDLEIKQGRWFGGFDSLENTLVKNELVQKEARTPKYSLMEKGQPLASRCSEFDYAVQNLTHSFKVPTIPVTRTRPVLENRQVCLLVDSEEPLRERFVRVARQRGFSAKTRKLPVGDFLWVLLPTGVNPDTVKDMPDQELVLPLLVERKTWDDLWSSLKTTRFINQVQRMKRCGLKDLFYLVEGSPKELKGNPGPEIETYLQDKIDSLLLDEQFLVNRTGSWLKTVEWLCHLTSMSIESLQAGGSRFMTYSEFSRCQKLKESLDRTVDASSVTSTVWSATEFTDAIWSHSCGGNELHDLPISAEEERSLIIIQGLTQYNKQCHKLLDKALADLLENKHQTAEACVQRHLHGVTGRLINEDVMQWYILWLQMFKGVIVRRTESEEESADILCQFYQNTPGGADAPLYNEDGVGRFIGESEENLEKPPHDDLMFANDSQEEDAMIRQALRASEYEDKVLHNQDVSHSLLNETQSSLTKHGSVANSAHGSISAMSEREQLALAMALSRVENPSTESRSSSAKALNQPCSSQDCEEVKPRTHTEVPKSTHTAVGSSKTITTSSDDELEKALKLSLEEFESANQRRHQRSNSLGTDDDLEKALELSKMEYEQWREGSSATLVGHHSGTFDRRTELEKVSEFSNLESGEKRKTRSSDESKLEHKQDTVLDNKEQGKKHPASRKEDGLLKVLQSSNLGLNQLKEDSLDTSKEELPSQIMVQDVDDDMAKALEQSKMDFSKEQSRGGDDLEKALELSRIAYMHSKRGVLERTNDDQDSDIIMLESHDGTFLSVDADVTSSRHSPLVADSDSFAPSSVSSDHEWDLQSETRDTDMSDARHPATLGGNTRDSAILLDSQEPLDDTADDFAYALQVQRELRQEVNKSSSKDHGSSSTKNTTFSELDQQLVGYRALQKEKYGELSRRREKSSPGVDFRRNVAAIACGKPVQIGIASRIPSSRSVSSQRGRRSGRGLGHSPMSDSRYDVHKCGSAGSPKKHASCVDEVHIIRDDTEGCKKAGSPSRSSLKNSCDSSFLSELGVTLSSVPFSSSSSFERVHKIHSSPFSRASSPPSSVASSSVSPSHVSGTSSTCYSRSTTDKPVGPKCGACGQVGHNKNSRMCPHYFSEEAIQKREEQTRKRKAKKEEEEREFNDRLGAMAAQRLSIEEQTRILGQQLDQLRRQSENMADTQKKVEDAIKRKRKR